MASPTKLLSIPIPASLLKRLERLAAETPFTVEELALHALLAFERQSRAGSELRKAFHAIREDANRKGVDKMTMREINAEIKAARAERKLKNTPPMAS